MVVAAMKMYIANMRWLKEKLPMPPGLGGSSMMREVNVGPSAARRATASPSANAKLKMISRSICASVSTYCTFSGE